MGEGGRWDRKVRDECRLLCAAADAPNIAKSVVGIGPWGHRVIMIRGQKKQCQSWYVIKILFQGALRFFFEFENINSLDF